MNKYTDARIGILGATGYAGRELAGLLAAHPHAQIAWATSQSEAGGSIRLPGTGSAPIPLLQAEEAPLKECDVVISCLPHGESTPSMERVRRRGVAAIDLSADLRVPGVDSPAWATGAVYGLPELHRDRIRGAALVANPGCYPTAALLALAPALRRGWVSQPVIINAASGVTGAGRSPKRELLFAEVAEDFRAYAVGNVHRHLTEMRAQVAGLVEGDAPELVFTPHLLPVRRGILKTIHLPLAESIEQPALAWVEDYADEPFVEVMQERAPSLADVVGTNRVAIGIFSVQNTRTPMLTLIAAIDNLRKGAAGQAVQNLNLMMDWPETAGLL